MPRVWIARRWRKPNIFIAFMILEFPLTVACLTLMGIADPNTYRTKLWQNGFDRGFNSAPNSILYAYANWEDATVPLVWSAYMMTYNVVISVLSMFILLVKSVMFVLHIFIPAASVFAHALLVAMYSVSIYNQSRPDLSDPNQQRLSMPWYLSKGCRYADPGNHGYCLQARASFAIVVVMTCLFIAYLAHSIWSSIPTEGENADWKAENQIDLEMRKRSSDGIDSHLSMEERGEVNRQLFLNFPRTPATANSDAANPMTPRTLAFTQLNGGALPASTAGLTRPLPFRDYPSDENSGRRSSD